MKQLQKITNSYELFLLINEHRVNAGKKPMSKHAELVRKMQDELEKLGNKKITKLFTEHEYGKKEFEAYELSEDEVLLVSMRESKEVRKSVLAYIRELEGQIQYYKDYYIKRQESIKGMTWDEACAYAGIKHSNYCRMMLLNYSDKPFTYFSKNPSGGYYVTEQGAATGYFYNRGNKFTKSTTMKISRSGREWLKSNRDWFNTKTDEFIENSKAAA